MGAAVITGSLSCAGVAAAAPGDVDTSYGQNGTAVVDFPQSTPMTALVVQGDGRAIGVGSTAVAGVNSQIRVARLTTAGQLDAGYGTGGRAQFSATGSNDNAYGAALQNDGKLLVGADTSAGGDENAMVGRLDTSGLPDSSFGIAGGNGLEYLSVGGTGEYVRAMALRPNGQIVLAGYQVANNAFHQMVMQVNNPAGSLDTAFQTTGIWLDTLGTNQSTAYGVGINPDGGIVNTAAETFPSLGTSKDIEETSVGSVNSVTHADDLGGDESTSSVLELPDGSYLVGGSTNLTGSSDFMADRVGGTGSFGRNQVATVDLGGSDFVSAMALQRDGKIVLAGTTTSGSTTQIGVVRLQPNGQLDSTFGKNGIVILNPAGLSRPSAVGVGLAPNGDIIVGGTGRTGGTGTPFRFFFMRVHGDATGSTGGGTGGSGSGGSGGSGSGSGSGGTGSGGSGGANAPRCHGQKATIIGTNGNDKLKGTRKRDVIVALGGNDRISGAGGNDLICAGAGADRVFGGDGNDTLDGGNGNDTLQGQSGNDTLQGGNGNDSLQGNGGADKLAGNGGKDSLQGGPGKDALAGGPGNDALQGGPGDDTLTGGPGKDSLQGGGGRNHDAQ